MIAISFPWVNQSFNDISGGVDIATVHGVSEFQQHYRRVGIATIEGHTILKERSLHACDCLNARQLFDALMKVVSKFTSTTEYFMHGSKCEKGQLRMC